MGFFDFLSSSSESSTDASTQQTDYRRVNTANGAGSLVAQDGGVVNFSSVDPGAFALAGQSVDQSLGLARQIASTLGASLGQFSVGATGSVDSLAHLLDANQTNVQASGVGNQKLTMVAFAVAGLIAIVALKRGR